MIPQAAIGSPGLSTILGILVGRRRWILAGASISAVGGCLVRLILPSTWEASALLVSVAPPIPDSYASVMRLVRGKVVPLSPDLELFQSVLGSNYLRDSVYRHPTPLGPLGLRLGCKSSLELADHWKLVPVNEAAGGLFDLKCRADDSALARTLCQALPSIALDKWLKTRKVGVEAESRVSSEASLRQQQQYESSARRRAEWLERNRTSSDPRTRMSATSLELEVGALQAGAQRSIQDAARLVGEAGAKAMPLIAVGRIDVDDEPIDPPLWRIAILSAVLGSVFSAILALITPSGRSLRDLTEAASASRPLDGHDGNA